jgi:excinuclease ABC subunit A
MHFLPDVYVPCEVCKGKRYNRETLEIKFKGKSIYDVLEMTIEEALGFFENIPKIRRRIQTIYDVGLGYVRLGQPATTLPAARPSASVASELSKRSTGARFILSTSPRLPAYRRRAHGH